MQKQKTPSERFLYFAYCANMLSSRMEYCIEKNVKRLSNARLIGYKLLFGKYSDEWAGCLPSVVKCSSPESVVWGTLWEVEDSMRERLDKLHYVSAKVYEPIQVDVSVLRCGGSTTRALCYRLVDRPLSPPALLKNPHKYRPSKLYMEVMLAGAAEAGLPSYYQKWLKSLPHNGQGPDSRISIKPPQKNKNIVR